MTAKAGDRIRDVPDYTLVGAYWDDAFPPPSAETVYRWAFPHVLRQVTQTFRLISDSANDWRGRPRGNQTRPKLRFWTRLSFQIHSVVLWVLLSVGVILSLPILAILFILTVLSKTPGLRLFGLWALVIRAVHTLDPFVIEIMGDSQRYVNDGVWGCERKRGHRNGNDRSPEQAGDKRRHLGGPLSWLRHRIRCAARRRGSRPDAQSWRFGEGCPIDHARQRDQPLLLDIQSSEEGRGQPRGATLR